MTLIVSSKKANCRWDATLQIEANSFMQFLVLPHTTHAARLKTISTYPDNTGGGLNTHLKFIKNLDFEPYGQLCTVPIFHNVHQVSNLLIGSR